MNVEEYITQRVKPRCKWYDGRALRYKRLYLLTQYAGAVISVSLVVLIHVEAIPRLLLASLAALVAVAVSVDGIGQFGNQWRLYRMTAEAIERELQLYLNVAGTYATVQDREGTFVRQIEALLSSEAAQWKVFAQSMARTGGMEHRGR